MKEIKTSKGILKYRMPNVLEVYDILDVSGVNSGVSDSLKIKRNIISEMGYLIDISSIEGVSSYEELLMLTDEMILPLSDISDEIMSKIFELFKKKI